MKKITTEELGAMTFTTGLVLLLGATCYALFELHWVLGTMGVGGLLLFAGSALMSIGNGNKDDIENEEENNE